MQIPVTHVQSNLANTTVNWLPSDTKERWLKNCKDTANWQYFEHMGWNNEDSITYTFNQYGFRSPPLLPSVKNFIALGCSFTVGTGLPVKTVWPSLIEQATGITAYNLGVYGMSLDACYRLARYYIPQLNPRFVIVLPPPPTRMEILENKIYQTIMFDSTKYKSFVQNWFAYKENMYLHQEKTLGALENLCFKNNCRLYVLPEFDKILDHARDLMHQGPKTHKHTIENFLRTADL
jgi:hypothetical protein